MVEEEAVLAVTGDFGQETRFGGSIGVFGQEGHHFGGGRGDFSRGSRFGGRGRYFGHGENGGTENWQQDMRTYFNCEEVGYTRTIFPKLYGKGGQFAHVAYASEGQFLSNFRSVFMSDEELRKYKIYQ